MFKYNNIELSRESAILLYYGIISNTINLKSKVTTARDISILNYLKEYCGGVYGRRNEEYICVSST